MESNAFMMPPFGKSILRSTGEEVEIIDAEIKERGARSDEDWVTYIDSQGKERIREHLNMQLDFKTVVSDTFNKLLDVAKPNIPSTRNSRIFEVAKTLVLKGDGIVTAVNIAKRLVDEIGVETE